MGGGCWNCLLCITFLCDDTSYSRGYLFSFGRDGIEAFKNPPKIIVNLIVSLVFILSDFLAEELVKNFEKKDLDLQERKLGKLFFGFTVAPAIVAFPFFLTAVFVYIVWFLVVYSFSLLEVF